MTEDDRFWRKRSKVCRLCGKHFIAMYPELYVYKKGNKFYCSWTCYRKATYWNKHYKPKSE